MPAVATRSTKPNLALLDKQEIALLERKRELQRELADPALFSRSGLGHDPWPMQEAILRSVRDNRWTSVKACHASGKTFLSADAVLWWIKHYPDGVVATTAPTWPQVEKQLWGEIRKTALSPAGAKKFPKPTQTDLKISEGRYATGLSTNLGVNFQGWHGTILIVIDEAPGVEPFIYEAIEGIRAGGKVHVLELGNPVIGSGPFYDSFHGKRMNRATFTISAFDTPNLAGLTLESLMALPDDQLDLNQRPYLTTRRWVKEKYQEWGPESPLWESRVMGEFPSQSEDALIPLAWAMKSQTLAMQETYFLQAGVDVAGPGDNETFCYVRSGPVLIASKAFRGDARGDVVAFLNPYRERLQSVKVDTAGLGEYFALHLVDEGFDVVAVNVGNAPVDRDQFVNLKSELYWNLRERFRDNEVVGLKDETTIAQLTSIRYRHDSRGRVVIESKEDARKRGVPSPDRAEALMLAFAEENDYSDTIVQYSNRVQIGPNI